MMTKLQKIGYILLSFAVAIIVWFTIDEANQNTGKITLYDVPIEYTQTSATLLDKGLMLLETPDSETDLSIDITFEGRRRLIAQLDPSKVQVTADLSSINRVGLSNVSYRIAFRDRKFSAETINVVNTSIMNVTAEICELNRKVVDIHCSLEGTLAPDVTAEAIELNPTNLEIKGREEDIAKIAYAKVVLDIGQYAGESVTKELDYILCDSNGNEVGSSGLHIDTNFIEAHMPITLTKDLTLVLNYIESPGYRLKDMSFSLNPPKITVTGDAAKLKNMRTINLGDFDLSSITPEPSTHSFAIVIPDGCTNTSDISRAKLEISYPSKTSKDFYVSNLKVENGSPEKQYEIHSEGIMITVTGNQTVIDSLTEDDFTVSTDLADFSSVSGKYTLPATVYLEKDEDVCIEGNQTMQVVISDKVSDSNTKEEDVQT